jgi:hypothetical protein
MEDGDALSVKILCKSSYAVVAQYAIASEYMARIANNMVK